MAEGKVIPFDAGDARRRHGAAPLSGPSAASAAAHPAGGAARSGGAPQHRTTSPEGRTDRAVAATAAADDGEDIPFRDVGAVPRGGRGRGRRDRGRARPTGGSVGGGGWDPLNPDGPSPAETARMLGDVVLAAARLAADDLAVAGRDVRQAFEDRTAAACAFLRRRLSGEYHVDDDGFDPELTDVLAAVLRPVYQRWFRVEVQGLEHVSADGAALVVANHSGTLPWDAVMTQIALHDEHPAHRSLRMLAADLVFQVPFLGELARKAGHTLACQSDAERLLGRGELVGVWPEGFKGIGKPFADRYKLQRFGRGGFVSSAIRAGAPIIPTAIVGAEEIYPMLADAKPLARLLGLPYFPITPTFPWLGPLGLIPLPSRWTIAFGEPIRTDAWDPSAADDPMLVFNVADEVRESIQEMLYGLLLKRRSVFH